MGQIETMAPEQEQGEKKVWNSRSNENQCMFFQEYKEHVVCEGILTDEVIYSAKKARIPEFIADDLHQFLGLLNDHIQFLVKDGLITYFSTGKREYSGLRMLDAMLDPLFEKMDRYVMPYEIVNTSDCE